MDLLPILYELMTNYSRRKMSFCYHGSSFRERERENPWDNEEDGLFIAYARTSMGIMVSHGMLNSKMYNFKIKSTLNSCTEKILNELECIYRLNICLTKRLKGLKSLF